MSIADNLARVRAEIAASAAACGRAAGEIVLVAVSKRQPAAAIREAYAAGQRDFGENYLQELEAKRDELADLKNIRWHFIGHLQSRKAPRLADGRVLLHGIDSASAAQKLADAATGQPVPLLLQINIGGEATKSGIAPESAETFAQAHLLKAGLDWQGLMAIPPETSDTLEATAFFRRMRELRDTLSQRFDRELKLSMGMSGDYEAAIAEGADYVRIGTAIFGPRVE